MDTFGSKLLLLLFGGLLTEGLRQFIAFIKGLTPRVQYCVTRGIPVEVDGKHVCGYKVRLSNSSRNRAEDITFHFRSRNDTLAVDVTSKPDGLEYTLAEKEKGVDLILPYLKKGDEVLLSARAESKHYFSESFTVSVSSPKEIVGKEESEKAKSKRSFFDMILPFIWGCIFLSIGLSVYSMWSSYRREQAEQSIGRTFRMDNRELLMSAASSAELPHIAELYLAASDPTLFSAGDLAYSYAIDSRKPEEINKYRRLLSLTLEMEPNMATESQANLFYSLGRLDLLLADEKSATDDFRNATTKSKAVVEIKAKADQQTRDYLVAKGIL